MAETTPLPTRLRSSRNVHVVSQDQQANLLLAPGSFGRNAALASLLLLPAFLYLCDRFNLDSGLWIAAILFPLFTAGGFLVGHVGYALHGTKVLLDADRRKTLITGLHHSDKPEFAFENVQAVQRVFSREHDNLGDDSWRSWQINLVFQDQTRYNLLDSGGLRQLDRIGSELAQFLNVPFEIDDNESQ